MANLHAILLVGFARIVLLASAPEPSRVSRKGNSGKILPTYLRTELTFAPEGNALQPQA